MRVSKANTQSWQIVLLGCLVICSSCLTTRLSYNSTMTRFDIDMEYQVSRVPGLLDAATVDDLNTLTQDYLSDFMRIREPNRTFFIDHVELLSQKVLSREGNRNLAEAEKTANLWVTVAVRGLAFSVSSDETTEGLIEGVDSLGYSNAIQNYGNVYLEDAYAFSAAAKAADSVPAIFNEVPDEGNGSSAAIVVVVVVLFGLGAFCASAWVFKKRAPHGLRCCQPHDTRKIEERDLRSPESVNVASAVGSMFSFDETTATNGTNGLMRYISSYSRSKESTSPGSSQQSMSQSGFDEDSPDEELGLLTPQRAGEGSINEEESSSEEEEEEEPHPLEGIIPPMVVYDHIDDEEQTDLEPKTKKLRLAKGPSVVPARRVEASSSFVAVLGQRQKPSATHDLEEYFRYVDLYCALSCSDLIQRLANNPFVLVINPTGKPAISLQTRTRIGDDWKLDVPHLSALLRVAVTATTTFPSLRLPFVCRSLTPSKRPGELKVLTILALWKHSVTSSCLQSMTTKQPYHQLPYRLLAKEHWTRRARFMHETGSSQRCLLSTPFLPFNTSLQQTSLVQCHQTGTWILM